MQDGQPTGPLQTQQPVLGGVGEPGHAGATAAALFQELQCPICVEVFADPFVTRCGHTFCYGCISRHLEAGGTACPTCSAAVSLDSIFPNFVLQKVSKRLKHSGGGGGGSRLEALQAAVAEGVRGLGAAEVDALLHQVWELKQTADWHERQGNMELLLHFLQHSREDKAQRLRELQTELCCLDSDIAQVESVVVALPPPLAPPPCGCQSHGSLGELARHALSGLACALPLPLGAGNGSSLPPAAAASQAQQAAAASMQPAAAQQQQQPLSQQEQQVSPHGASSSHPLPGSAGTPTALVQAEACASCMAPAAQQEQPGTQQQDMQQPDGAAAAWAAGHHQQQQQQQPAQAEQPTVQPALEQQQHLLQQQQLQQLMGQYPGLLPYPLPMHAAQQAQQGGTGPAAPGAGAGLPMALPLPIALPILTAAALKQAGGDGGGGEAGTAPDGAAARGVVSLLRNKKRRISSQFDDLQQCYLRLRGAARAGGSVDDCSEASPGGAACQPLPQQQQQQEPAAPAAAGAAAAPAAVGGVVDEGLQEFSRMLSVLTRCNKLKVVAEIPRPSLRQSSSIISSLEFDPEGGLFATAGVSRRISIFDYAAVASAPAPAVHCPVVELATRSKLSCLSWNKYLRSQLASSDYEGVVTLWDVGTGGMVAEYEAHSRRIWSVDCCEADPCLLASGSDDCAVKLWSTRVPTSLAQLELKANVCAVKWRPGSAHELAVGSADHMVYLYDMRHTARPRCSFLGHHKAVSYVRFCSAGELVTASTDSTLRLWPLGRAPPSTPGAGGGDEGPVPEAEAARVFEGHTNEKNFVGLAVDGDFIACGSETNEVFVYFKALTKPVAWQAFSASPGGGDAEGEAAAARDEDKSFISAVAWRPRSSALLAANSLGTVKLMQLSGAGEGM